MFQKKRPRPVAICTPGTAFTLVELLVAIAIIGILMALLLPAVQMAREAARAVECKNHLKQIGLAAQMHHDLHQHLPTNGWGFRWVGQVDRGFVQTQPGGWVFNLLPFVEQQSLRDLGVGTIPAQANTSMKQMLETSIAVFQCPSRRGSGPMPYLGLSALINAVAPSESAKCDYAGNGGHVVMANSPGPLGLTNAQLNAYPWPNTTNLSGLFFVGSRIRLADITDGTSNVYLVGEKYVRRGVNPQQRDIGDDQTMYVGDDTDIRRWTAEPPLRDANGVEAYDSFGSAHPATCHFVFADGSVHAISFTVDAQVHRRLGSRHDGEPVTVE